MPANHAATPPRHHPTTRPPARPIARPPARPTAQPPDRPTARPTDRPTARPTARQPASLQARQPVDLPTYHVHPPGGETLRCEVGKTCTFAVYDCLHHVHDGQALSIVSLNETAVVNKGGNESRSRSRSRSKRGRNLGEEREGSVKLKMSQSQRLSLLVGNGIYARVVGNVYHSATTKAVRDQATGESFIVIQFKPVLEGDYKLEARLNFFDDSCSSWVVNDGKSPTAGLYFGGIETRCVESRYVTCRVHDPTVTQMFGQMRR